MKKSKSAPNIPLLQPRVTLLLLVIKELKATNETLKSLQTQLELAYATTASSGSAVAGSGSGSGCSIGGLGSGTMLGGSVAVPGGVPGSTTLTAILETKDARIQTLEKEVMLLEAELQRIKECGGRLREQLLRATAVPSGTSGPSTAAGILFGGPSSAFARGSSGVTSLVPYSQSTSLTNSFLTGSTGAPSLSGNTTGVANPYHDRYTDHQHQQAIQQLHQQHHLHHSHQYQQQQAHLRHLKQIEPAAAGALALHAHTFNKHDMNFKRQVSFFINNVRIEKNDTL